MIIKGGRVLTATGWADVDVGIEGTAIAELAPDLAGNDVLDASGCLVGPGFVDLHTHLRDPGQTWKEDIASGTAAAAAGGYTAVTAMPNTEPALDSAEVLELVMAKVRDTALIDVIPAGTLTLARAGAEPADVEVLYRAGVRLFTDDGDTVAVADVLEEVMRRIAVLPGALVAQHAEDHSIAAGGHLHDGEVSRRLGVPGLPSEAESEVVSRDLDLLAGTGGHYHCQHVSSKMTVELIRKAKKRGLAVTAEVTPHHLSFDQSFLEDLDPNFKMYPPLRSAEDRQALVDGLRDGTIDVVATDHAPHLAAEKDVDFVTAPRGVIGLETAAAATWECLRDPARLFETLSIGPSRILGLRNHGQPLATGAIADLVIFEPDAVWTATEFRSKSQNSPFREREMRGKVRATVHRGRIVHDDRVGAR